MATDLASELWRPALGWEGLYEVSSHGRVRSLDREIQVVRPKDGLIYTRRKRGMILLERPARGAARHGTYLGVTLQDRGAKSYYIHTLVCEAFHGPRPSPIHLVCHGDGNPKNNHASNLRWGTHQDNMDDMRRHGSRRGVKNPASKLDDEAVRQIRRLYNCGLSQRALANRFSVTQSQIWGVLSGNRWRHVQ